MSNIRSSMSMVDRMTPTLRSILRSMDSMLVVMKNIDRASNNGVQSKAYQRAESHIKQANNQLVMMRNHALLAASGADDVADAWNRVNSSVNKSGSSLLKVLSGGTAGAYALKKAVDAVTKVAGVSDSATSDIAKLSLFNTSGQSDAAVYGQVYKTAQSSRADLSSTAGLAQRIMLSGVYEGAGATRSAIDLAGTINKAMALGGGTTEENNRAILQLSQALSSGLLQGDELRSLREQSPYLMKVLAEGLEKVDDKFIGTTIGDLKQLGNEGQLTSEVVVKALQAMSVEIDETFNTKAPKTFSGALTSISNTVQFFISVLNTAEGPLGRLNAALWDIADFLNTPQGFEFLSSMVPILNIATSLVVGLGAAIQFVGNNMSIIAPIFGTLLAMLAAYNLYLGISKAVTWAHNIAMGISAVIAYKKAKADEKAALAAAALGSSAAASAAVMMAGAAATAGATAAQHGFNAALWACPITWIIAAIIAVIGLVFLVVGIINKATGSSTSAIGIIVGAIAWLASVIWNTIVGVIDAIIQFVWQQFVQPWIKIVEFIVNAFNGGFDGIGGALLNLLGNMIASVLSFAQIVTKILDAVAGTDLTSKLEGWKNEVVEWGKNENAVTYSIEAPSLADIGIGRWDSGEAWDAGYSAGEKLSDLGNIEDLLSGISTDGVEISGGSLDSSGSVDISDEDIQLLRDMTARDYLIQLQSITPVANVTFGDVRETADVNKIVEVIETMVEEQMATSLVS